MLFAELLMRDPARFAAWVTVVAFSVCLHETAHAWAAWQQGDDTAVRNGFGDMDPRRLMGWPSLLALVILGIAWGAVPVVPARLRRPWSAAWVSLAGPLTNLLLAVLFGVGSVLTGQLAPNAEPVALVLRCGLEANCLLALFNLLPVPPFDGWTVAAFVVPPLRAVHPDRLSLASWVLLTVLFVFPPASQFIWSSAGALAYGITHAAGTVIGSF